MKIRKKIFFYVGGAVIFITILLIIAFSYKEQPKEKNLKQHEKFSNQLIIPLTKPSKSKTFPIENIPDQREDINSQLTLEQRKKGQKLSPAEEKTIIESLASQVDIDKEKSYFDYN
jgi:hypothetical protein